MKKIYYIAMLLSLGATNVAAEEFLPIFEPGKMFVYQFYDGNGYYECSLEYQDDTEVDGKKCVNVKFSKENSFYKRTDEFVRTFREADGCCQEYVAYGSAFVPYVDFNVKAGDELQKWAYGDNIEGDRIFYPSTDDYYSKFYPETVCKVKETDIIEVNGIKRRRVRFDGVFAYNIKKEPTECIWVEGIGPNAPNMLEFPIILPTKLMSDQIFTGCYLNGECIFTEADFHAPALTELREIEAPNSADGGAFYDLSGRRVDRPRRGQIYVSNGRKLRL